MHFRKMHFSPRHLDAELDARCARFRAREAGQPEPRVLDPEDPTHACGMPRRVERLLERGEEVCNDHL